LSAARRGGIVRDMDLRESGRAAGVLVVLLAGLACQRGHPLPEPSASIHERGVGGQRLRAIWMRAEGGASGFLAFEDTQLGLRCRFRVAADGTMRCLPEDAFDVYRVLPLDGGRRAAASATSAYGRGWQWGFCPTRELIYRRGAPVPGAQPGTHEIEDVPPETFVGAAIDSPMARGAATPLSARVLRAEDGAVALAGWHDGHLGVACDFRDLEYQPGTGPLPSPLRCAPEEAWFAGDQGPFADAACTRPAVATDGGRCEGDRFVTIWADKAPCRGQSVVHRVGSPLAEGFERVLACSPAHRLPRGLGFAELGARVDESTLPPGRLVAGSERGRVRTLWLETAAGRVVAGLWDSELEGACAPHQAQGTWRCRPVGDHFQRTPGGYHADAACTRPLVIDAPPSCRRPRIVQSEPGSPDSWQVGNRHDGPLWYRAVNDGVCRPSERPQGVVTYLLGPNIPLASLPVLEEQRR
jgi:hypothetical protein